MLWIELTNAAVIIIPVKLIADLKRAAPSDVQSVEVLGRGGRLHWESLDLDLSVPALVSSVFAGPNWMAELGRVGGRRLSAAKAAAARRNGRKGGRPRVRGTGTAESSPAHIRQRSGQKRTRKGRILQL